MGTGDILFTNHGQNRLLERISLSEPELVHLITTDRVIPLGKEKNRVHYLLYSIPDQKCYVVVMDTKTREIITILPVRYHNRWRISPDAECQAEELACQAPSWHEPAQLDRVDRQPEPQAVPEPMQASTPPPRMRRMEIIYRTGVRELTIGAYDMPEGGSLRTYEFEQWVAEHLQEVMHLVRPNAQLLWREGRQGGPIANSVWREAYLRARNPAHVSYAGAVSSVPNKQA